MILNKTGMFGFGSKVKKYKEVKADKFQSLIDNNGVQVIDVRTSQEKSDGIIPGYQMINLMSADFENKVANLDKNKTYLIYCRSGNRSKRACNIMADMGFKNLYNLIGGIRAWNNAYGKTND